MPFLHTSVLVATASSGILTGCLAFGSLVDARTITALVDAGETDTIKRWFGVWWPNGRDLMVPLVLVAAGLHGAAFTATGNLTWLCTGAATVSILPYTALVLGEDISALRKADATDVKVRARRFCLLHHPRTIVAAATLGLALRGLAKQESR